MNIEIHGEQSLEVAACYENTGDPRTDVRSRITSSPRSSTRKGFEIRRAVSDTDTMDTAAALNNLGVLLLLQGRYDEALPVLQENVDIVRRLAGDRHPELAKGLENLGNVYYRLRRFDRTLELLDEVMTMRREVLGDDSPAVARTLNNMGMVYNAAGEHEQGRGVAASGRSPDGAGVRPRSPGRGLEPLEPRARAVGSGQAGRGRGRAAQGGRRRRPGFSRRQPGTRELPAAAGQSPRRARTILRRRTAGPLGPRGLPRHRGPGRAPHHRRRRLARQALHRVGKTGRSGALQGRRCPVTSPSRESQSRSREIPSESRLSLLSHADKKKPLREGGVRIKRKEAYQPLSLR